MANEKKVDIWDLAWTASKSLVLAAVIVGGLLYTVVGSVMVFLVLYAATFKFTAVGVAIATSMAGIGGVSSVATTLTRWFFPYEYAAVLQRESMKNQDMLTRNFFAQQLGLDPSALKDIQVKKVSADELDRINDFLDAEQGDDEDDGKGNLN